MLLKIYIGFWHDERYGFASFEVNGSLEIL
jgi:hypothetical protein